MAQSVYRIGSTLIRRAGAGGAWQVPNSFVPDFFIGPSGSDSNNGLTPATAWAITALNTKGATYGGKKIGFLDGTYPLITIMGQPVESSGHSQRGRLHITGGSSGSPTVLRAINPRAAVIDYQRASMTNNSMEASMDATSAWVELNGLVFDNNNYHAYVNDPGGGSGIDNLTFKNCLFRNQSFSNVPSQGQNCAYIFSQDGDNILVSNCRFVGGDALGDLNRHNQIHFFTPTVGATVEFCTFLPGANSCDIIHGKNGAAKNLTIRNCYTDYSAVTQSSQTGYPLKLEAVNDVADTCTMQNCIIVTGGTLARSPINLNPNTAGVLNINNNTFIGPWTNDGGIQGGWTRQPTQFNGSNNIFQRVSGAGGTYGDINVFSIATIGAMDRNFFTSAPKIVVGNLSSTFSTLAAWQSASSKDANSALWNGSDPMFTGTGSEAALWKLATGCPCLTLGAGGTEIGAWAQQTQIGSNF